MSGTLKAKLALIFIVVVWAIVVNVPNVYMFSNKKVSDSWFFSKDTVSYGLDILGGLHLVMGVEVDEVINESLRRTGSTVEEFLKEKGIPVASVTFKAEDNLQILSVNFKKAEDRGAIEAALNEDFRNLQKIGEIPNGSEYRLLDLALEDLKKKTVEQSIETIRNRIDEFGVSEPSIAAQGDRRILIQLPGRDLDVNRAKELINKTAKLEFLMVANDEASSQLAGWVAKAEEDGKYSLKDTKYSKYIKRINEDLKSKVPEGMRIFFGKQENVESMDIAKIPYLLEYPGELTGDHLKNAFVNFSEYNEPQVSLAFSPTGARIFGDLTGKNVNRLMAIVLDGVVYSAPSIKERIGGGRAVITLGGGRNFQNSMEEAKVISMALRAGALPATLEQLEERRVGPTLGEDSINKGKVAITIAAILVLFFMLFWYKGFGILADIALILNMVLILAVLTSLQATLTLPGIAGIALTIGMAVDANVIVFERIKEEMRKGLSLPIAIRDGYAKAFSAIFDANLTTAATSIILMYFGTGPVRGFAVTLLIGIITSMFSALFVTHTILDVLVIKFRVKKIPI